MAKPVREEFIPLRRRPNPFYLRRIEAAKRQEEEAKAEAEAKARAEEEARARVEVENPKPVVAPSIVNPLRARRDEVARKQEVKDNPKKP